MSNFDTISKKVCSPTIETISFLISLSNSKIISGSILEPKKKISFFLSSESNCSIIFAISPELRSDYKLSVLSINPKLIESIKSFINLEGTGEISFFNFL